MFNFKITPIYSLTQSQIPNNFMTNRNILSFFTTISWLFLFLAIALTLTISAQLRAQPPEPLPLPSTTSWRMSVAIETKIAKKLKTQLTLQTRIDNEIQQYIDAVLGEWSLQYEPLKQLDLSAGLRYKMRTDKTDRIRQFASIGYTYRIKPFNLKLRTRYQTDFSTKQKAPEHTWRNRLLAEYTRKKIDWTAYSGAELFYSFNNEQSTISRYRLIAGASYKINKHHTLNAEYAYQRDVNVGIPQLTHIVSTQYNIDF